MIRLKSRRNDRENRRRRPFPGLVHTPGTPLLHHLGGATDGAASLRAPASGGARSEHQHFAAK